MDDKKIDFLYKGFRESAEALFGPAKTKWVFGGVEFGAGPCLLYRPSIGTVHISLSNKAINDEVQLWFQLSHEVCHLLHPSRDADTNEVTPTSVLNEGISTLFSYLMTSRVVDPELVRQGIMATPYGKAFLLAAELMDLDSESVKKLRARQPKIDRLQHEDFTCVGIDFSSEKIAALIAPLGVSEFLCLRTFNLACQPG